METAVIVVHAELVRSIDAGKVCAPMLLDLSAAFDTVDHDNVHQVLSRCFGVQGSNITWFDFYENNQMQTF